MNMTPVLIPIAILAGLADEAKRPGPPIVAPVIVAETEYLVKSEPYSYPHPSGQEKGYWETVSAIRDGKTLWQTRIYRVLYNSKLETDAQDVWPTSMKVEGESLVIVDEHGEKYELGKKSGKVQNRKDPRLYFKG